jgi:sugar/nucleoside kinase (ribokinase family)
MPLDVAAPIVGPFPSGASAITISTAARLGLSTGFVGIVGKDFFGEMVLRRMRSDGVDLTHVEIVDSMMTGIAFVMYNGDGSRKYNYVIDYSKADLGVERLDPQGFEKAKWIHTNGTMLGDKSIWKEYGRRIIERTLEGGGSLSFDSNFRPELMDMGACRRLYEPFIRMSRHFMPSEEEILAYFDTESLAGAIDAALAMGPEIVCVKCGSKGCVVASASEGPLAIPGFSVDCADPTGAGDSFNAGFIFARERGLSLHDSAVLANAVGAFAVSKLGPMEGCPYPEQLKPMLAGEGLTGVWEKAFGGA